MLQYPPWPLNAIKQYIQPLSLTFLIVALVHQADTSIASAKSAFLPKKAMLEGQARDLELIQKSLDENNSQLKGQMETLASFLPRLISRRTALSGLNFNQERALISKLKQIVGISPYETNPRLLQELQLKRFELGIPASAKQTAGNTATPNQAPLTSSPLSITTATQSAGPTRFNFQQVSYLLPGDPLKQGALTPNLKERLYPGTFRILIDSDARFLIYASDITGQPLRIGNTTVFQEGQLY